MNSGSGPRRISSLGSGHASQSVTKEPDSYLMETQHVNRSIASDETRSVGSSVKSVNSISSDPQKFRSIRELPGIPLGNKSFIETEATCGTGIGGDDCGSIISAVNVPPRATSEKVTRTIDADSFQRRIRAMASAIEYSMYVWCVRAYGQSLADILPSSVRRSRRTVELTREATALSASCR